MMESNYEQIKKEIEKLKVELAQQKRERKIKV